MKDLTLIIPAKREAESLPIFLKEIENYECKKLIVLQKEDIETKKSIENIKNIEIHEQNNNGYGNALIEGINSVKTEFINEKTNFINPFDLFFVSMFKR